MLILTQRIQIVTSLYKSVKGGFVLQFYQIWQGRVQGSEDYFPVHVPGNIQADYAEHMGFGDTNYGLNFQQFHDTEGLTWEYSCRLCFEADSSERIFFVSEGIDYIYDIALNGNILFSGEGMFSDIELPLEDAEPGDLLTVIIHPHPKREGAIPDDRQEADSCCKPPVSYGWDWHPRVIPSGLWNNAYIETRNSSTIVSCEPFYTLNDDFSCADLRFETVCEEAVVFSLYDPDGELVAQSDDGKIRVENPLLWWCNGQGEQNLYMWTAESSRDRKSGFVGFRRVRLVMNDGAWDFPNLFPKSRSDAPMTIELNGRRIFAKGSNFVNPDIFTGCITEDTYEQLVSLAAQANMNIFRCWGGSGIQKKAFYELCDKYGIMLWVEFPLACNNYPDSPHYLSVLEREGSAIIKKLRRYASVVLWCGGNELFNSWSGMTEQSLPLRLLDKLCYELDPNRPYIMTSPLNGAGHGGYTFYDDDQRCDVFELFQKSRCTAYTEFGVPGVPDEDYLRSFIPENELFPPERGGTWEAHHAFGVWGYERWLCLDVMRRFFGEPKSLGELVKYSQWMQCEGYKAIFEEARRQSSHCSMAVNWCYCEPWKTAANNSLISYPLVPKKAYYAVSDSLRPLLFSARIPKFDWHCGELFSAEIWLLNDLPESFSAQVSIYLEIDGRRTHLLTWDAHAEHAGNLVGPVVQTILPETQSGSFKLILESGSLSSEYTLRLLAPDEESESRQLNV